MGNAQVPDVSRLETQLWFYYQAASYIDLGFEAIHFGQVEIMNRNDRDNAQWEQLLTLVRAYAAKHARRHMVLCDGHTPSGGLVRDGRLLLDFHAFPLRIKENPDKPQEAILKVGFSDGIYGQEQGRASPPAAGSASTCPTWWKSTTGASAGRPGRRGRAASGSGAMTRSPGLRTRASQYRADWLQYAWDWVRKTDPNGYLQMPGSRTVSSPDMRWYFANNPSPAVPNGLGDEEAIRAVWAADSPTRTEQADKLNESHG